MLSVLCLNAGIDRTYNVDTFRAGGHYRPQRMHIHAGGKGINVARIAHRLGVQTIVSGFAGGAGGAFIARNLRREGILTDFIDVEEEPRVCINIVNQLGKQQTRIDEPGPLVSPAEVQQLRLKWRELLAKSECVVLSGSAPRGVPNTIYAELIATARSASVPVILDARDELLAEGVKGIPLAIKPNLDELAVLKDQSIQTPQQALTLAKEVARTGISIVLVSMGGAGAIAATRKQGDWVATPPKVDVVSSVGCGDAMVAGFTAASLLGREFEECFRWGCAAGAANAAALGNAACTKEGIIDLISQVKINRVDHLPASSGDPLAATASADPPEVREPRD